MLLLKIFVKILFEKKIDMNFLLKDEFEILIM